MEPVNQAGLELSLNEKKTGKENMLGKTIFQGTELLCPVSTTSPLAIAEQPELRAYKLGKQKCSYNQVELVIKDIGGGKITELKVSEAIETCVGSEVDELLRGSCLKFNVRFVNNNRMHLYMYVVYATPVRTDNQSALYQWIPVTRAKCRKSCKGPVIRGLQRFGRMPRRNAAGLDGEDSWKEPRHLYIAIDEASTHVCPRHETSKFRLLVAAFDDKNQLLGTTVSSSIRVLANNDAPLGAASFKLHCHIKVGHGLYADTAGGWNTSTAESPIRNAGHRIHEKAGISRSPLQDIIQNSSPPKSYRSTTTDDTIKEGDQASTHNPLLDIDLNKEIFDDSDQEGDENDNVMSESRPAHTATTSDEAAANLKAEKEHSLTDLCERLLMACVAKQEYGQASVTLRLLANTLGARRKRILEIINVLETINVVQNQGKEKYLWLGSTQIASALLRLKGTVQDEGNSTEPNRILIRPAGRRPKSKAGNTIPRETEDIKTDIHNPMRSLSKKFVQLFLIHEKSSLISWEQMLEYIVDGQGDDPETIRAKTRRLGEVARIFTALHLIKKVTSHKSQPSLVYEWLGSQGVAEHLVTLAELATSTGSKKVDGRRTRVNRTNSRSRSPPKQENKGSGAGQSTFCDSPRFNLIQVQQSIANMKSLQQSSISLPVDHFKSGEASARGQHVTSKVADTDENAHVHRKLGVPRKKRVQRPFENISTNKVAAVTTSVPIATLFRTSCGDLARSSQTAFKLSQSSLSGHIRGEIASQLDLSLSHQQSQFPNWKVQVEKISTWGVRDSEPQCSSVDQEIFQNSQEVAQPVDISILVKKDSCEVQVLEVSTSSEHPTQGQTSPDKTDAGSTTTDRSKRDNFDYSGGDEGKGSFQGECSFKFTAVGGTAWRKWQKPIRVRAKDSHVSGSGTVTVHKAPALPSNSANEMRATSGTLIPRDRTGASNDASLPSAQHVPYKKRKFNYTSGDEGSSMCGETNSSPSREDDGRSGQVPAHSLEDNGRSGQEQEHPSLPAEDDGQHGEKARLPEQLPDFDPIGNLLKYINPQMLLDIQALNSSFLYEYVKQARSLYNKQMAERWTRASSVNFPVARAAGLNLSKRDELDRIS